MILQDNNAISLLPRNEILNVHLGCNSIKVEAHHQVGGFASLYQDSSVWINSQHGQAMGCIK